MLTIMEWISSFLNVGCAVKSKDDGASLLGIINSSIRSEIYVHPFCPLSHVSSAIFNCNACGWNVSAQSKNVEKLHSCNGWSFHWANTTWTDPTRETRFPCCSPQCCCSLYQGGVHELPSILESCILGWQGGHISAWSWMTDMSKGCSQRYKLKTGPKMDPNNIHSRAEEV